MDVERHPGGQAVVAEAAQEDLHRGQEPADALQVSSHYSAAAVP